MIPSVSGFAATSSLDEGVLDAPLREVAQRAAP